MDERRNVLLWIGKNGKDCGQTRITYYIQYTFKCIQEKNTTFLDIPWGGLHHAVLRKPAADRSSHRTTI